MTRHTDPAATRSLEHSSPRPQLGTTTRLLLSVAVMAASWPVIYVITPDTMTGALIAGACMLGTMALVVRLNAVAYLRIYRRRRRPASGHRVWHKSNQVWALGETVTFDPARCRPFARMLNLVPRRAVYFSLTPPTDITDRANGTANRRFCYELELIDPETGHWFARRVASALASTTPVSAVVIARTALD